MLILALMGYFPGSRLLNVAAPQNGIGAGILLYRGSSRGYPQNRHFQYQRNPLPVAGPARMVSARRPDVVCLQELKAPDAAFPINDIQAAGYGAIWHGQAAWNGVAILAKGMDPRESRRGLPGDEGDTHSRYLEGAAHGVVVGCLYLPNGNPQPGPK